MISITNYLIILIKYTLINKLLFWVIVSLLVYTCQALKYFHLSTIHLINAKNPRITTFEVISGDKFYISSEIEKIDCNLRAAPSFTSGLLNIEIFFRKLKFRSRSCSHKQNPPFTIIIYYIY